MNRRILLWPAAREDLLSQAEWLEERNPAAGERFLAAATAAMNRLAASPMAGRSCPTGVTLIEGIRSWPVRGFGSILLFYRPVRRGIEVLRMLHGARDLPGEFGGMSRRGEEE